jgi:hypothetical protein
MLVKSRTPLCCLVVLLGNKRCDYWHWSVSRRASTESSVWHAISRATSLTYVAVDTVITVEFQLFVKDENMSFHSRCTPATYVSEDSSSAIDPLQHFFFTFLFAFSYLEAADGWFCTWAKLLGPFGLHFGLIGRPLVACCRRISSASSTRNVSPSNGK